MKSIRQKREIRSKGLVSPQIAPKNLAQPSASGVRIFSSRTAKSPGFSSFDCRVSGRRQHDLHDQFKGEIDIPSGNNAHHN